MIYLAAPYSSDSQELVKDRMYCVNLAFANLSYKGKIVFSVLSMTHTAATKHGLPGDAVYWTKVNFQFLKNCSELYVLCLPGWAQSKGVQREIKWAKQFHIPITYIDTLGDAYDEEELPV